MTAWVVGTVLVLSCVILFCASFVYRNILEDSLDDTLNNEISSMTQIIDLRMSRVEYATKTVASTIGDDLQHRDETDTLLMSIITGMECIDGASVIYRKDAPSSAKPFYDRSIYKDEANKYIFRSDLVKDYRNIDSNWIHSYKNGENFWSSPFVPVDSIPVLAICYSVPLCNDNGERYGILCSTIKLEWIEKMVVKYKTDKNIDVSIIATDGEYVVRPDDKIANLTPDKLYVEERRIDRLGWRMVFSVQRSYINDKVLNALLNIGALFFLLLIVLCIAIIVSISKIARPFVNTQRQMAESKAAMQRDLDIASETQHSLVPHRFPPFPEHDEIAIHALLKPARDVGGDLYDYFIDGDHLYFCIGDVSGKGVPASLFMSATHYLFHSNAMASDDVSVGTSLINKTLCHENSKCNFVTFFFGRLNIKTGELNYCNAGHNAPMLNDAYISQEDSGMPLGIYDEEEYKQCTIQLSHGDTILLYTDGITESMNAEGEELGNERALACFNTCRHLDPEKVIASMSECVQKHAVDTPQHDDITMLCIKFR